MPSQLLPTRMMNKIRMYIKLVQFTITVQLFKVSLKINMSTQIKTIGLFVNFFSTKVCIIKFCKLQMILHECKAIFVALVT